MGDLENFVGQYPAFKDDIVKALNEGKTPGHIKGVMDDWINGALKRGYSAQAVSKVLQGDTTEAAQQLPADANSPTNFMRILGQAYSEGHSERNPFSKGLARGVTMGYVNPEVGPAETPGEIVAGEIGSGVGQALPIGKAISLTHKVGSMILPKVASPIGQGLKMAAEIMTGLTGLSAVSATPKGGLDLPGRATAVGHTLTDPYAWLGAASGGALRTAGGMATQQRDMITKLIEAKRAASETLPPESTVVTPPKTGPTEVTPEYVQGQYRQMPDQALLAAVKSEIMQHGEIRDTNLSAILDERGAEKGPGFKYALGETLDSASRDMKTAQRAEEKRKAAIKNPLTVALKNGEVADLTDITPEELVKASNYQMQRVSKLETSGALPEEIAAARDLQRKLDAAIPESRKKSLAQDTTGAKYTETASGLDAAKVADYVQEMGRRQSLGTRIEENKNAPKTYQYVVRLFDKAPSGEFVYQGARILSEKEYQQYRGEGGQLFKEEPPLTRPATATDQRGTYQYQRLVEMAGKLFPDAETPITDIRILNALKVDLRTANAIANDLRMARDQITQQFNPPRIAGASSDVPVPPGDPVRRQKLEQALQAYRQQLANLEAGGKFADVQRKIRATIDSLEAELTGQQAVQDRTLRTILGMEVSSKGVEPPKPVAEPKTPIKQLEIDRLMMKKKGMLARLDDIDNEISRFRDHLEVTQDQVRRTQIEQTLEHLEQTKIQVEQDLKAFYDTLGESARAVPELSANVVPAQPAVEAAGRASAEITTVPQPKKDNVIVRAFYGPTGGQNPIFISEGVPRAVAESKIAELKKVFEEMGVNQHVTFEVRGLPEPQADARLLGEGVTSSRLTRALSKQGQPVEEIPTEAKALEEATAPKRWGGMSLKSGTRPSQLTEIRLPDDAPPPAPVYSTKTIEDLAGMKGYHFSQTLEKITLRTPGLPEKVFAASDLKGAIEFLTTQGQKADPRAMDTVIRGGKLTDREKVEIQRAAQEAREIKDKSAEPPDPRGLEEDLSPDAPPEIAGGSDSPAGDVSRFKQFFLGTPIEPTAMGQLFPSIGRAKGWTQDKTTAVQAKVMEMIQKTPGLWQAFQKEWSGVDPMGHAPASSWNPFNYLGQPQSHPNILIREPAQDALVNQWARSKEYVDGINYHNKWWGKNSGLDEAGNAAINKVIFGRAEESTLSGRTLEAYTAAKQWLMDIGRRLDASGADASWIRNIKGLVDFNQFYQSWRSFLVNGEEGRRFTYETLPTDMQEKFTSKNEFHMVMRAVEKQGDWQDLPTSVKRFFRNKLSVWDYDRDYSTLPKWFKDNMPEEMYQRFSISSGAPMVENWSTTFQHLMPLMLDRLYTDPFVKHWQPMVEALPGREGYLSTRGYLDKYLKQVASRRDGSMLDWAFDGLVQKVENVFSTHLADPRFISRLAGTLNDRVYRAVLGGAVDTATGNLFQSINTFAENGTISRAMVHYMSDPNFRAEIRDLHGKGIGVLQELAWNLTKIESTDPTAVHGVGPKWLDKPLAWDTSLREMDAWITSKVMLPMKFSEFVNRGVALMAGLEEAYKMGLDHTSAMMMGYARASRVFTPLKVTEAQMHALMEVQKTQFGYGGASASPYFTSPLAKSTMLLWSYPMKQLQFMMNGVSGGFLDMLREPGMESVSRFSRYMATVGFFAAGPYAAAQIGIDLTRQFGSGLFPQLAGLVLGPTVAVYNAMLGREDLTPREWNDMWRNLVYWLGIPAHRYMAKVGDVAASINEGVKRDAHGRVAYESDMSELTKLLGVPAGRAYRETEFAKLYLKYEREYQEEKKNVLSQYLYGDPLLLAAGGPRYWGKDRESLIDNFNERWGVLHPKLAITADTITDFAKKAEVPFQARKLQPGIREKVEEKTGYRP